MTYQDYSNSADHLIINAGYMEKDLVYSIPQLVDDLASAHYDEKHIAFIVSALVNFEADYNRKVPPVGKV